MIEDPGKSLNIHTSLSSPPFSRGNQYAEYDVCDFSSIYNNAGICRLDGSVFLNYILQRGHHYNLWPQASFYQQPLLEAISKNTLSQVIRVGSHLLSPSSNQMALPGLQ